MEIAPSTQAPQVSGVNSPGIRIHDKYEKRLALKMRVDQFEDRKPVLSLASIPYLSNLRFKKVGTCMCNEEEHYHMSFLDFNSKGILFFRDTLNSKVEVCYDNYNLFDRRLPKGLGVKSFWEIKTFAELNELLFRATHWYSSLWDGNKPERTVRKLASLATGLGENENFSLLLNSAVDAQRLSAVKNVIANCDGVMTTLFLFWEGQGEEKKPSWADILRTERFLFKGFLGDYLMDPFSDVVPFYARIKEMKNYIFGNVSKEIPISREDSPFPDMFIFYDMIEYFQAKLKYRMQIVKLRVVSDTRCVGLPPPIMREKAYEDFWKECITPSRVPDGEQILLVQMSIREILEKLPEKVNIPLLFERCFRNEKISLSGSSDLESTGAEGGKIESANYYLREAVEKGFHLINLETGEKLQKISFEAMLNGEYTPGQALLCVAVQVYRKAIDEIMDGSFDDSSNLFDVRAIAVSDQSKYRIATASHFLYNVVLQPVAQTLKALFRCFESTAGGMDKQYHMWEFFKRIPREMLQYVRLPTKPQEVENYFFCEDWKKATDKFNKFHAKVILRELMDWVGIPSYMKRVVDEIYSLPKRVFIPDLVRDVPSTFFQLSGVFQGDPITKNILQISHIIARQAAIYVLRSVAEKSTYQRGQIISSKKKYDSWEEKKVYVYTKGGIPMSLRVFKQNDKVSLLKSLMFRELPKSRNSIQKELLMQVKRSPAEVPLTHS